MDELEMPELGGFDLTSFVPPAQAPQAPMRVSPGALRQPSKADPMQSLAPLMMLLPMVLKGGGQAGMAALLQGIQQARQQKQQGQQQQFQNNRLLQQDERVAANDQAQEEYRQQQLANQQRTQQDAFRQRVMSAAGSVETPEAARALLDFVGGEGAQLGIPRSAVEAYVMETATPAKLIERQVKKVLKEAKPDQLQAWQQAQGSLMVNGKPVPYDVWSQFVTGAVDAQGKPIVAAPPETKPETRSLDVQAADALAKGDTATYHRLLQVKKEMGQADDRPRITVNTGAGGLPAAVLRRVDAKTKSFEALPIVKTTQKMAEAATFANTLNPSTANPADDQALIYAFAKAMDPDSVVREGEYATVQHYAQSWAQSFGFNAARIFSNTAFLTPEARQNMKKTIMSRFAAARGQYDNVRKSYASQINRITNAGDGEEYLTDYAGAFPAEAPAPAAATTGTSDRYKRYQASKKGAK